MKRKAVLLFLIASVFSPAFSMGGHHEEVNTWFRASPGFVHNDSTYFLLNYHLFRSPKGISRFPDGGQSETVDEGVFLMELEEGTLKTVMKVHDRSGQDLEVMGTRGRSVGEKLELLFTPKGAERSLLIRTDKTGTTVISETDETGSEFTISEYVSITDISNALRDTGFSGSGLPSPLEYISKKNREFKKDIVELKGDLNYRKAVIFHLELTAEEAEELLEDMDRRLDSLEGSEKTEYRIYSEDTRLELEKITGLTD